MTKKPPKIFMAANDIAKKPKILDVLNILSVSPANPAIIAPTIITEEIALAAINIFGGFLVTQRMLAMYKKKKKDK